MSHYATDQLPRVTLTRSESKRLAPHVIRLRTQHGNLRALGRAIGCSDAPLGQIAMGRDVTMLRAGLDALLLALGMAPREAIGRDLEKVSPSH